MTRYAQRTLIGQPSLANWGQAAAGGIGYGVATGGDPSSITVSSQAYTLLTFTSDDTLTVTTAGLFDVLLVGAGGTSGYYNYEGGGAGGQVLGLTSVVTAYFSSNQTVTIGTGPARVSFMGGSMGGTTKIGEIVAMGGGGSSVHGASGGAATAGDIQNFGWNGGGASNSADGSYAGVGGYAGGTAHSGGGGAGGGGGSGGAGNNGANNVGGAGGAGVDLSAWLGQDSNTTRKAGGGGGRGVSTNGTGADGGGNGGNVGTDGTENSGGGAGGHGAIGGSGILYVRFKV